MAYFTFLPNKRIFKTYDILKALCFSICLLFGCLFLIDKTSTSITEYIIHRSLLTIVFLISLYEIARDKPAGYDGVISGIIIYFVTAKHWEKLMNPAILFPAISFIIILYASKKILFPHYKFDFKKQS